MSHRVLAFLSKSWFLVTLLFLCPCVAAAFCFVLVLLNADRHNFPMEIVWGLAAVLCMSPYEFVRRWVVSKGRHR